jgi:hypothetical protein
VWQRRGRGELPSLLWRVCRDGEPQQVCVWGEGRGWGGLCAGHGCAAVVLLSRRSHTNGGSSV